MTPEEYLRIFSQRLKGFSPEEQASLLEEIGSHIESYEEDLGKEKDPEQRRKKMMSELGSPKDLGNKFKMIYRPDRLLEFLFVALPYLLYPLVNIILHNLFGFEYVARAEVALYSTLILIGLWRQFTLATLFWATMLITQIISMILAGYSFYGDTQPILWLVYAIGLVILAAKIVWQNRNDPLIVLFACLPLIICAYGSIFVLTYPQNISSHQFGFLDKLLLDLYMMSGSGNGGYFQYFGYVIALALFILFTNRDIRWLALALFGLIDTLSRSFLNLYDGLMSPWVYSLYILIPLATVFLGWWVERNERKQVGLTA